ncbi:MAG: patatin family protein [Erysipelotrichaceae bacterium]|nr:patatin family protein [Erysipelotrichaceae bacterium]
MSTNVYSGIDKIPAGSASDKITEGCLVLEGGAFRGLYTQGVLDAFMLNDINFQCVVGTSAGAMAGMNYVSGNIGRSARANLTYRHNSYYIGVKSVRKAHSLINLDFLLKDYNSIELINIRKFFDPRRRFVAVCTNCSNGDTLYFDRDYCGNIFDAIKASATMPFVSPMVNVDGIYCLDGGSSCKIPYQWALDQGYEKVVVIKTRENGFRKKVSDRKPAHRIYINHQAFAEKLDNSPAAYNAQCDELEVLEKEGRLYVMAPSQQVTVSRVESDIEKLGDLYWLGYNDALASLDSLREYLNR